MSKRTLRHGGVVVASLALALTACGGSSDGGGSSPGASGDAGGATTADGLDCTPYKAFGDIKGKTVSIYTSIVAPEDQPQIDSYKPFEKCTGVTVKYEGNKAFENQLQVRIAGGNAPDVAYIPQPGLLAKVVATGKAIEAPKSVSDNVDKWFGKDWRAYGTVNDKLYAAPLGANVKSFVWYSPKVFADKGYTVPTTWDEMTALSDKIAADNPKDKPWCVGFESGDATGWTGTDWVEDVLLRTGGPDVYDQWVNHKIAFNDPQIADALARVGSIIKNPKYVNGGLGDVKSIATTSFSDAGLPILDGGCYLHRQASFYAANWPKGTDISENGDVFAFYLPPIDAAKGKPVLGAGEFVASFRDAPEVTAFRTYLSSPEWANIKAKLSSGWVTANKGADQANFANPIDKLSVQILQDPKTVFRFDGSDQMPAAVGSGTFWKGMTDWITGKSDAATLDFIEKSWPKS